MLLLSGKPRTRNSYGGLVSYFCAPGGLSFSLVFRATFHGVSAHMPALLPHCHIHTSVRTRCFFHCFFLRTAVCLLNNSVLPPCLSSLSVFYLSGTYLLSKIRSFALFERLFASISYLLGRMGFLVTILPFDTFPHTHTGKSGGQVQGFSFFLNALFTILSSSEWNVIMHSLPPGFNSSIMSSSVSLRTSSSRFNSYG